MQKTEKERGWRIGDRLDTWDGPEIYRAIWLPNKNYYQVWARKLTGVHSMAHHIIVLAENDLLKRIYKDEI